MRRKIIVTGHASGIGYHLANRFHDLGFSVTGIDKNISDKLNCEIEQIICDLSDEVSVTRTFRHLSGYTFAVNCAGVSGVRDKIVNLGKDDLIDSWEKIFIPTFLSLREEIKMMNEMKSDAPCKIVNIASFTAMFGCKNMLAYSAAKASIVNLTKVAAVENSPGVLINSVSPATIDTPLIRKKYDGDLPDYSSTYLTGNCGSVEDVFLAVDMLLKNNFITGFDLVIDGGFSSNFEVRQ
ncbi:SDR family NAD(P)-dependent oxidoreductase [Enterobacter sp. UPMP2060]